MSAPSNLDGVVTQLDRLITRTFRAAYDAPTATADDCTYVVALLAIAESAASVALLLDARRPESAPGAGDSVPAPGRLPSNPYA
ncbi:hypothetical protein [Nocardia cyriacigeorgica]|uniref:hypothetical protein n=1 Tax=Nocardia cyriacigeorgica TaxID=135487 RepID=UPI0013D0D837|nr:hypothetical protein [Nocardia cyriacigeorgica]NEW27282.1 hypothetical protein [Nocardia cyriacigeorgica]